MGVRRFISIARFGRLLGALLIVVWFAYPAAARAPAPAPMQVGLKAQGSLPLQGMVQLAVGIQLTVASGTQSCPAAVSVIFRESVAGVHQWAQAFDTEFASPSTTSPSPTGLCTYAATGALDTTTLADGNYDVEAVASDGAGATGTAELTDQTVANQAAAANGSNTTGNYIQMDDPGTPVSGTVSLNAEPDPAETPPDTVTFWMCKIKANTSCDASGDLQSSHDWTNVGTASPEQDSSGNFVLGAFGTIYNTSLDTKTLADGTYDLTVTGEDRNSNPPGDTFTGGEVSGIVIDNTAPTVSLRNPGGSLAGNVQLTADAADSGSGLASVKFEMAPAGSGQWTTAGAVTSAPYSFDVDTRQFVNGSYDLRAEATDLAGNTTTSNVVSGVTISNQSLQFSGLNVTDIAIPASNITLLGELPGAGHETWAIGQASGEVVVLRYTDGTGWQILDPLLIPNGDDGCTTMAGCAWTVKPGTQVRVTGAMVGNGEAWAVVNQVTLTGQEVFGGVFHRVPGAPFKFDQYATTTLGNAGFLGNPILSLGETEAAGTQQVYGTLFRRWGSGNPQTRETVWTSEGPKSPGVGIEYAELAGQGNCDSAPPPAPQCWELAGAAVPPSYVAPSDASVIKLQAGAASGPGAGWGAIELDTNSGTETILGRFDSAGWTFEQSTGLDVLDSAGPFSDSSAQAAAAGHGVSVTPTALGADANGGFIGVSVRGAASSGTAIAEFDAGGRVVDSWCSNLPQPSNDCAHPIDDDHPAVVPNNLFSQSDHGQYGIELGSTPGTLSIYTHGGWESSPAPGFQSGVTTAFADPTDGWIAGKNTMGLVSATAPASPMVSWPEANRQPLTSVALPPGNSTTDTAGALAVGLDGTALHYDPAAGWQVDATPNQTHHLALTGVAFAASSRAFAVGQAGTILDWNGNSWSADPASTSLTQQGLNAVAFSSDGQGWAVGAHGTILHYDGSAWSAETINAQDSGTNVTSVAVAGHDVFAIAGGNLIERNADGTWQPVPGSQEPTPAPGPGALDLVSGLPDGGLVVTGNSLLMTRDSSNASFEYAPVSFSGIPVALAAFRDTAGNLRAFVSASPPIVPIFGNSTSNQTGGFPAGDGDLLLETDGGWQDLSEDTPATSVTNANGDGVVHPDPVLGVAASPDGAHAWAVGGYAGTQSADGVGTSQLLQVRSQNWFSSSVWRFDAGGSASSPTTAPAAVSLPATQSTVNFAYLSSAICKVDCGAVHDAQPDVNLQLAATQIAAYAQQPGGPAFAMFGGNAHGSTGGPPQAGSVGILTTDLERFPSLLAPLAGLPTYAAYGPLDIDPATPDPAQTWANDFANAPAPFGPGAVPPGVTPQGSGDATASVNKYYAFDVSQNGGALRVIVLDNSQGSLEASAPGQTGWLTNELTAAQAANIPVVVFAAEPLDSLDSGAASDGDSVAAQLAASGVLAVFTTAGGDTGQQTWSKQTDQVNEIPANAAPGAAQIPEYEGATMTYQQNGDGVLWYDASVNTQTGALTVNGIPVIGSLALDALDGLTVGRSSTLQFAAIGRRPQSTIATTPGDSSFPGYDQYVSIPASSCTNCIRPSYTFTSSDPVVGNFVVASGPGSPYPKLTADGKTTASSQSGLFCAFNSGTTTVTVTAGLMSASLPVTVNAGGFGPPCGTVPGGVSTNVVQIQGKPVFQVGQGQTPTPAPAPAPASQVAPTHTPLPKISVVPPAPPVVAPAAPAPAPAAPPPAPRPLARTQQPPPPAAIVPFIAAASPFASITPVLTPPVPPPITPVPPGGATAPAQSTAKREERARKHARQSAYVTRPAGQSAADWFYPAVGVTLFVSLLLIGGGLRPGPKRAPAYAVLRETTERRRRRG
jgi:hypothetical protein